MIEVIDDVLPEEVFTQLMRDTEHAPMRFGWKSSKDIKENRGHWNCSFSRIIDYNNLADITPTLHEAYLSIWNKIKETRKELEHAIPVRCYMNGHTYGVEGLPHTDTEDDGLTVLFYLTDKWNINWGGETAFYKDGEIIKAVVPKKNRGIIFSGNIKHAARNVTYVCPGLRKTFMFKTRTKRSDNFEKLSKFLFEKGAAEPTKRHVKGSLHDHLMRVYQLLEDRGEDQQVCFGGGLHSVFGTNIYKDPLFELSVPNRKEIVEAFGPNSEVLASSFSFIDRPATLEDPVAKKDTAVVLKVRSGIDVMVPEEQFEALRLIEAANLYDQDVLDKDKYPSLYDLWHSKD